MTKNDRLKLNSLSKLVYGTNSKWQKLLQKGEIALQEEILEDQTIRKYKGYKRPTLEELTQKMETMWVEKQAKILKEQEEKEKEVKKVVEEKNV